MRAEKSTVTSLTRRKHSSWIIFIMALVTLVLALASLCIGRYQLNITQVFQILYARIFGIEHSWPKMMDNVIFQVRLPRIAAAILVGGGLALSGTTYQGVFQNPLVAPDLLGVSAGACVGASAAILLNMNTVSVQLLALVGGLVAVACTMLIPRLLKNNSTLMLVLAGVIVSGFMNSIIGILKFVADSETQLPAITYWQMGSLSSTMPSSVLYVLPAMVISIILLLCLSWRVNLLSLGDVEATSLGVNISRTRTLIVVAATMLTACAVCISGIVSWVGLIVPHITRLFVGSDNTKLMPASFFVGASFMLIIDTIARSLMSVEIPLSILSGLIGAPIFVWLLVKTKVKL